MMTEHAATQRLVLAPGTAFDALGRQLEALGWQRLATENVAASPVPGEPHLARWRHASKRGAVVHTFNPVVDLRVLEFHGENAGELRRVVEQALPVLRSADLKQLLNSSDPRRQLLGIFAAGELQSVALLPRLHELADDPDERVAGAAQRVVRILAARVVEIGAQKLEAEARTRPDRSALFSRLGGPQERCQILRCLLHDYTAANDEIVRALRSGLEDPDWEVRATAMLAAARFDVQALGADIRRMPLPATTRDGLVRVDREILVGLRKAVLAHLAGTRVAPLDAGVAEAEPSDRDQMRTHFLRIVAGEPGAYPDRACLLVRALTARDAHPR